MKVFYFTGTDTTLHLSPTKLIRLTKHGQRVELTDEEAERHATEAPLMPEAQWNAAEASPSAIPTDSTAAREE